MGSRLAERAIVLRKAGAVRGMRSKSGMCARVRPDQVIGINTGPGRRWRRGQRQIPLGLKRFVRSRRLVARATANEPSNVRKLCRRKLACDLFDTSLVEQRDGRYDSFGHAFCGSPP